MDALLSLTSLRNHSLTGVAGLRVVRCRHKLAVDVADCFLHHLILKDYIVLHQPARAVVPGGQRPLSESHSLIAHNLQRLVNVGLRQRRGRLRGHLRGDEMRSVSAPSSNLESLYPSPVSERQWDASWAPQWASANF